MVQTVEADDAGRFTARLTSPPGERLVVRLDADLTVLGPGRRAPLTGWAQATVSTATRKSESGVNGCRCQVDSSTDGASPAVRASARNSSKA